MRKRVAELVGPRAERMWVSTFHSACLRILRTNADRLGYRSAFTVYDDTDSRRLVEMITAELGFDPKRLPAAGRAGGHQPGQVRAGRLRGVPRGGPHGPDPFRKRIADVYAQYQAAAAGGQRPGLRRPADGDGQPAAGVRRRARTPTRSVSATFWWTSSRTPTTPRTRSSSCSARRTATSAWSATPTSRSTAGVAPTSATSWSSSAPSPTSPPSCWSRTSVRPRPSSTRPTRSSPTTWDASPRSSSPSATPAARSPGTGPRTSTTRRRGSRARSCVCTPRRTSPGATSRSSTAPTRRACRSRPP